MLLEISCMFANLLSFFFNHENTQSLIFLAFVDIRNGQ